MKIYPNSKKTTGFFINNILLICAVFSMICFFKACDMRKEIISNEKLPVLVKDAYNSSEDFLEADGLSKTYGPISIEDKPKIYMIKARFSGDNTSNYLSGEVLDEEFEILYEFGKEFWHESGRDSEGFWSEGVYDVSAYFTFSEKGVYYIKLGTEDNGGGNISVNISQMRGSYIVPLKTGAIMLIAIFVMFLIFNMQWLRTFFGNLYETFADNDD